MKNYTRLPMEGAYNVRDLGGYPAPDKKTTAWNVFFRGDDLSSLTKNDINLLKAHGLKTVVDLRTVEECNESPDVFRDDLDVEYVSIPIFLDDVDDITKIATEHEPKELLTYFYLDILARAQKEIKEVFSAFARSEGAVLFHCMVGKDRTGIIAVLLLGLCGVSDSDIIANYISSYHYIADNPAVKAMIKTSVPALFYSRPEYIEPVLEFLNKNYAGAEKYLESIGVTREEINTIKNRFTF